MRTVLTTELVIEPGSWTTSDHGCGRELALVPLDDADEADHGLFLTLSSYDDAAVQDSTMVPRHEEWDALVGKRIRAVLMVLEPGEP